MLIEGRGVSKRGEVVFEGLCLDAARGGDVFDRDLRVVWLAGHRAHGREILGFEKDRIVAAGMAVRERIENVARGLVGQRGGFSQEAQRGFGGGLGGWFFHDRARETLTIPAAYPARGKVRILQDINKFF